MKETHGVYSYEMKGKLEDEGENMKRRPAERQSKKEEET